MLNQPNSEISSTNIFSQLAQNMSSDNYIMLAAIVSLLLVILFVLLLHIYAKWFLLAQSNSQSNPRRPVNLFGVPISSNFHHHFNIEATSIKGLNSTTLSTIPTFVSEEKSEELECVICLSYIEEGEIGRKLPKCGHVFHVECIDMWLNSHCNCPICRALIVEEDSHDGDVVEIVIDTTPSYEISESGSVSVSETSSLSLFGFSFKRILSKVFLSSHVNELDDGSL